MAEDESGPSSPLEVDVYLELDAGLELGFEPNLLDEAISRGIKLVQGRRKGSSTPLGESIDVSLLITGDDRIHELNRDYRHIDSPTDVLSFPQHEGDEPFIQPPGAAANLGDIVISLDTAKRQAIQEGHSLEHELAHLALHGTLHLLGYDHQTDEEEAEMNALENQVLGALLAGLGR